MSDKIDYHVDIPIPQEAGGATLGDAWRFVLKRSYIPILAAGIIGSTAAGISLLFPNIYTSSAKVVPTDYLYSLNPEKNTNSSIGGRLLGLAGGGTKLPDPVDLILEVAKSRDFIVSFVNKHGLAPELFATKGWDTEAKQYEWDRSLYNPDDQSWEVSEDGKSLEPNKTEIHNKFLSQIEVTRSFENGVISMRFTHISPERSRSILTLFIKDLNEFATERQRLKSKAQLYSLEKLLESQKVPEIRDELVATTISHMRILTMLESWGDNVLEVIDRPALPDIKSGPFRALISLAAAFIGGLLGLSYLLIKYRVGLSPNEQQPH